MALHKEIFRAYDIRGIVDETLSDDDVYLIGCAYGTMLQQQGEHRLILARDGRLSSPHLHSILLKSLQDSGCDVIDIGIVPTPVLYFATHTLDCPNGVMLTASHNPANYNGLKMVLKKRPLMPEQIQSLYHLALTMPVVAEKKGHVVTQAILINYEQTILSQVKLAKPLKIVVDCANGVTAMIAPDLLRKLGCEVVELYCKLDGRFPNHAPDPSEIENLEPLIQAVKTHHADAGFAFDGDGDRVMIIDEIGNLIFPDYLLMLFTQHIIRTHPKMKVIFDVKCTRYLPQLITQLGGVPLMNRTGHSFMKMRMYEEHALLGGEASGHLFWQDRWYGVDDGTYTAARLLEILAATDESLSALMSHFPRGVETPEFKLAMAEDQKASFMEQLVTHAKFPDASLVTIDGLRVEFPFGWGLVRVSNTSPYLTFRFEADTEKDLHYITNLFRTQLLTIDQTLSLPF